MSGVSKQTVKNKIHRLNFPKNEEKPEKKGDLIRNENQQKNNCLIIKPVYVHEGIEKEAAKSRRHKLLNPYYFCGVNTGEENTVFWDEVCQYLENHRSEERRVGKECRL